MWVLKKYMFESNMTQNSIWIELKLNLFIQIYLIIDENSILFKFKFDLRDLNSIKNNFDKFREYIYELGI